MQLQIEKRTVCGIVLKTFTCFLLFLKLTVNYNHSSYFYLSSLVDKRMS